MSRVNRHSQFIFERLKEMLGEDFDPVVQIGKNAMSMQSDIDGGFCSDAFQARKDVNQEWERCAKFLVPTLKAQSIDLGGSDGGPTQITVEFVKSQDS